MPATHPIHEVSKDGYLISTDPKLLDHALLHDFLSKKTDWREDISPQDLTDDLADSLCFGLYHGGLQIGFASVTTDFTSFAYLTDVFVLEKNRGQGLAKWLMETVTGHPALQGNIDWMLSTEDAHGLYGQFGFSSTGEGGEQMERLSGTPD